MAYFKIVLYIIPFRTMLIGAGFLEGNWEDFKKESAKVNLIEPVLEGVMQLFIQYIILYIIYGPGTSNAQSKQISKHCMIQQAPTGHGSDFFKDCPLNALC